MDIHKQCLVRTSDNWCGNYQLQFDHESRHSEWALEWAHLMLFKRSGEAGWTVYISGNDDLMVDKQFKEDYEAANKLYCDLASCQDLTLNLAYSHGLKYY